MRRTIPLLLSLSLLLGLMLWQRQSSVVAKSALLVGFTVNTTADTADANPGNGVCADASGNCSLRAAISEANALVGADTITLPAGTYTQTLTAANEDMNAGGDWDIKSSITILGAGAGTTIVQAAATANTASERVLQVSGTVELRDLTIANGKFGVISESSDGGGIYNSGTLTLTNCTVSNNAIRPAGGTFSGANRGGGIYNNGTLTLTNSTLTGNSVSVNGANNFGGGLFNAGGTVTITGSTLSDNTSGAGGTSINYGGGIYNDGNGMVTITSSTLSGNMVSGGLDAEGGGIFNGDGMLKIVNSTLTGNSGEGSANFILGGGILNGSTLTITGSTLTNNVVKSGNFNYGGGIHNTGTATLINSTLSGNLCEGGNPNGRCFGGALASHGTAILSNCTLYNNSARNIDDTRGGGVYTENGTLQARNTIIAGNSASWGSDIRGNISSLGNNLVSIKEDINGFVSSDLVDVSAVLGSLASNGGPTQTHALLPGSPAIDAGNDCVLTNTCSPNPLGSNLTLDQRGTGFNRKAGARVDIGAFESRGFTLSLASGSPQMTPINAAFPAPLTVNVTSANNEPVIGGQVMFNAPASGASATLTTSPATITANGQASVNATANGTLGSYQVVANTPGAVAALNCSLTNSCQTITVTPTATTLTGTLGAPFTQTFTPMNSNGATMFNTLSTLPNGLTLASNGVLSGTALQLGSFPLAITVSDMNGCSGTANLTLTIACSSFTVGTPTAAGAVGSSYSSSVAAGPAAPSSYKYQYSLANGTSLPSGLTLDGATGGISGTPAVSGSFSFDLKAELLTSGNVVTGCSDTQTRSLNLSCPSFAVGTPTSTAALGAAYSSSGAASPAAASGFKYRYTLANNFPLPPGLTLDAVTGGISGTTTTSGSFSFDLKAELRTSGDGATGCSNTQTRTINVACASNPVVTNLNDSGAGSLRAALATACAGSTITFAPGLTGTITLSSGELTIPRSLTIQGPGANLLTISGNHAFRIFDLTNGPHSVTIGGLNLLNGNGNGVNNTIEGGAIYNHNQGTTTLRDLAISGSAAPLGGAIEFSTGAPAATMNLLRCTLSGNTASFSGGGIDIRSDGVVNVINSTIANNQAPANSGGGIGNSINVRVTVNLVHSTVTGNQGGGIQDTFNLSLTARNSLLTGNAGPDFLSGGGGGLYSSGYNLFGTGVPVGAVQPTDQVGVNPLLELDGNGKPKLAFNGGPTPTIRLLPGSPALDKGAAVNDPSTNQPLTTDQRGQARPYDFPGVTNANGGNGSDIGAYEYQCAALTLSVLPNGVAGVAYSQLLNASGGLAPYSLSVTSGQLPPGLTLTGNTLAGVPTGAGTAQFTVTVTDGYGCTGSQTYALTVACPPLSLTPVTLPNANLGAAYSQTVTASPAGTTYTYLVTTNTLPLGLSLNNATGVLSGTPTAAGNYSFVITATGWVNGAASCSATRSYNLLVTATCSTLTVSPGSLAAAAVGTAYSQSFTASGGTAPYSFSVTAGTLPPGLTLASNGALSGTPSRAGTYSFTVTATGGGGCTGSQSYTLTLSCPTITLTPASLPSATAGVAYNQTVTASPAGSYSYTLATGSLPPGLSLNATTEALAGTATTTGSYAFSIKAERGAGCSAVKAYTLVVSCPTITVNPASLPNGSVGTTYNQTLSATPSGSYTFAVSGGALPGGLTLSTAGGLSGTPTASGRFTFTVKATSFGNCNGTRSYTVTIAAACAPVTLPSLPNAVRGVSYYGDLSGTLPSGSYSFSLDGGTLPAGLTLDNLFGALVGTPTASGTFAFTLKATSANGCSGTRSYNLVVGSGAAARAELADYDGDGVSDLALWSAIDGVWRLQLSSGAASETAWGSAGDVTLLGDYDGDGKTDLAVFRPGNATWYVKRSSDGQALIQVWGQSTDVPMPGDYDGDGQTDLAVWRGKTGEWLIQRSSDGQSLAQTWGSSAAAYEDRPVAGDFDGDGQTDLAVFRRTTGTWLVKRSSDGQFVVKVWGYGTDVPVAADYDGDGKADLAVWRAGTGEWFVLRSSDGGYHVTKWGTAAQGDVPVVGDYDGDGLFDVTVWRANTRQWFIQPTRSTTPQVLTQGQASDAPIAARR